MVDALAAQGEKRSMEVDASLESDELLATKSKRPRV